MIQGTLRAFPVGKERQEALKAIQWRLRGPNGEFVGLKPKSFRCAFVPESDALIFDGQDNEHLKHRVYSAMLGAALTVEILPQMTR